MRSARFCNTKYCSVVALPSLTSWVHFSSGILIPNALSMAKAMSRKSRLSMPRSSIAWLSGVMVSRGMSQVSAIISATLSNVEDIIKPLISVDKWRKGATGEGPCPETRPVPHPVSGARISEPRPEFNGGGRRLFRPREGIAGLWPSGSRRRDAGAGPPAHQHAILGLAEVCDAHGKPDADGRQRHRKRESGEVCEH